MSGVFMPYREQIVWKVVEVLFLPERNSLFRSYHFQ
jgi:hypothetical protein